MQWEQKQWFPLWKSKLQRGGEDIDFCDVLIFLPFELSRTRSNLPNKNKMFLTTKNKCLHWFALILFILIAVPLAIVFVPIIWIILKLHTCFTCTHHCCLSKQETWDTTPRHHCGSSFDNPWTSYGPHHTFFNPKKSTLCDSKKVPSRRRGLAFFNWQP